MMMSDDDEWVSMASNLTSIREQYKGYLLDYRCALIREDAEGAARALEAADFILQRLGLTAISLRMITDEFNLELRR